MPSKITILAKAGAAAAAFASVPSSTAMPVVARDTNTCTSLGTGALGYNASNIGTYATTPPEYYIGLKDENLVKSESATTREQVQFEFFNCTFTPPPSNSGEGAASYWTGYIKFVDGNCVAVEQLNPNTAAVVKTQTCNGGVGDQHFQFSTESFESYYTVTFLNGTQGPIDGSGDYSFAFDGRDLEASYTPGSRANGDAQHRLLGQLGDQYKPQPSGK